MIKTEEAVAQIGQTGLVFIIRGQLRQAWEAGG